MAEASSTVRPGGGVRKNPRRWSLSVAMVACNEEANLARTLASVIELADEINLIDSGSSDGTLAMARSFGPKVRIFEEPWQGFARQKNSAIDKATGAWVLLLDADEAVSAELAAEIETLLAGEPEYQAYWIPRLTGGGKAGEGSR